jgi:hypothetical protein
MYKTEMHCNQLVALFFIETVEGYLEIIKSNKRLKVRINMNLFKMLNYKDTRQKWTDNTVNVLRKMQLALSCSVKMCKCSSKYLQCECSLKYLKPRGGLEHT